MSGTTTRTAAQTTTEKKPQKRQGWRPSLLAAGAAVLVFVLLKIADEVSSRLVPKFVDHLPDFLNALRNLPLVAQGGAMLGIGAAVFGISWVILLAIRATKKDKDEQAEESLAVQGALLHKHVEKPLEEVKKAIENLGQPQPPPPPAAPANVVAPTVLPLAASLIGRVDMLAFGQEIERAQVEGFFTTSEDSVQKAGTVLHRWPVKRQHVVGQERPHPPHELPPRALGFVGRQAELQELCTILRQGQSAAVIGMGGAGKSALAAEAVHWLESNTQVFTSGFTWVGCEKQTGLPGLTWIYDQLLAAWDAALAPGEIELFVSPEDKVHLREQTLRKRLRWISQPASPRALVLLDNVERDLPLSRALDNFAALNVTVLLTTRSEPASPRLHLHRLEVLEPEAALQLFTQRYASRGRTWNISRDQGSARRVVKALEYLPLAIEVAAARAALHGTVMPLAEELSGTNMLAKLNNPLDTSASVRYVLKKSVDLLTSAQRARFAVLGLSGGSNWPHPLALQLFSVIISERPPGDDLEQLAALSLVSLIASEPMSKQLQPLQVRLHPLLRALALEEWAQQRENLAPNQVIALVKLLFDYLDLNGHWRLGIELLELQRGAQQAVGDRADEARTLRRLAVLAEQLGHRDEARRYFEQALALARETGNRRTEGAALNDLGLLLYNVGRREEGAGLVEQSLQIFREIKDLFNQGASLNNLGAFAEDAGNFGKSMGYHQQALNVYRKIDDKQGIAVSLENLGCVTGNMGRMYEARKYHKKALTLARKIHYRQLEAIILKNFGDLVRELRQPEEALHCFEQALAIAREMEDTYQEGLLLSSLGLVTSDLGHQKEGLGFCKQALALVRESSSQRDQEEILNNLGKITGELGDYDQARNYFQDALALARQTGRRHIEGKALENLGQQAQTLNNVSSG